MVETTLHARSYAIGEKSNFIDKWVMYCFGESVRIKGVSESAQVSFFNRDGVRLYTLPVFLDPISSNGRATQLLLNQIAKMDTRVDHILFSSSARSVERGNVVVSHLEYRGSSDVTYDFVHDIENRTLIPFDVIYGSEITAQLPMVFFGFFHEPEVTISRVKWDRVNSKLTKIIKAVERQDRSSVNSMYKLLLSIYSTLVKLVEDLPDQMQPQLVGRGNSSMN